jgi:hypothetical protein
MELKMQFKVTDEQLIEIVNKYMEEHPTVGRNHVILHAFGNPARIRNLDKQGLITLPKPMPTGSNSNWARYFNIDRAEVNASKTGMKYNVHKIR